MNRLFYLFICLTLCLQASSQRSSFVYFQTEDGQPFFLKMGDKIKSSTASGYLILSQLADSNYRFTIGFPNQKWPDQAFSVPVQGKDKGYLIKNFAERGWGLFDLQTLDVNMSQTAAATSRTESKPVSDFTNLLSKAANDPSLKETTVTTKKEEQVPQQPVTPPAQTVQVTQPVVTIDSAQKEEAAPVVVKQEEKMAELPKQEVAVVADYSPSRIIRKSENSTTEGTGILFIDEYTNGSRDSIAILIPPPPYRPPATPAATNPENDKKFLDIQANANNAAVAEADKEATPASNCKAVATQNDFLKLRKKMAAHRTDDAMLDEAKKAFRQKCYTTAQLKNLHTLFLNDAARYQFFDAAYPYVADVAAFPSLESEFRNDYYLKRFKAIIKP